MLCLFSEKCIYSIFGICFAWTVFDHINIFSCNYFKFECKQNCFQERKINMAVFCDDNIASSYILASFITLYPFQRMFIRYIQKFFRINVLLRLEQLSSIQLHTFWSETTIQKAVKMPCEGYHAYYKCSHCSREYSRIIAVHKSIANCGRCHSPNYPYQRVTFRIE